IGGPSVSGCPEYYPDADLLHIGELGDATDRVIEYLDRHPGRPAHPLRYVTAERLPLTQFPTPADELIRLREYFIANLPFSSCCRTSSTGRSATAIRCAARARRRSTSPRTSACWS